MPWNTTRGGCLCVTVLTQSNGCMSRNRVGSAPCASPTDAVCSSVCRAARTEAAARRQVPGLLLLLARAEAGRGASSTKTRRASPLQHAFPLLSHPSCNLLLRLLRDTWGSAGTGNGSARAPVFFGAFALTQTSRYGETSQQSCALQKACLEPQHHMPGALPSSSPVWGWRPARGLQRMLGSD